MKLYWHSRIVWYLAPMLSTSNRHCNTVTTDIAALVERGVLIRTCKETKPGLVLILYHGQGHDKWHEETRCLANHFFLEGGRQNLRQLNCSFTTISSQFFGIYIYIFQKTEVQTVILRCWTFLYLNWFYSYGIKG